ncbi:MAG: HYExAFE family protein [Fimbriiglobus sp.]
MDRSNHYEVAFEAYLRSRNVPFVAVDEAKRSLLEDGPVKSVDFIVVGPQDAKLVVDVKGRRFPGGPAESPRFVWQNWCEHNDIDGLGRWACHFGPDFRGVLAFVYHIGPPFRLPTGTPDVFAFREQTYLMRAADAVTYRQRMRPRSRRWDTVHLPTAAFREVVRPFSDFLQERGTNHRDTENTEIGHTEKVKTRV